MYKYFKAKEKLRKIFNYFSIFTIIFGTTFGSLNSANAAAIDVDDGDTVTSSTTDVTASTITLTTATTTDAWTAIFDATTAISVTSITTQDSTNDGTVTISGGTLTVTGAISTPDHTAADETEFVVASDGLLTVGGSITIGDNTTIVTTLEGGTLTLDGASAQAIGSSILSDSGNDGILTMTGAGKKTFSAAVGGNGTNELGAASTASATEAEFDSTLDVVAYTNAGTTTLDGASAIDTVTNTGTFTVNAALENIAANGNTAITMSGTSSILGLRTSSSIAVGASVAANTDGDGTINIVDTNGAAPGVNTVAGAIGSSSNYVGTMNIGDGANAGSAVFSSNVYVDTLNIKSGTASSELSKGVFFWSTCNNKWCNS